MNEYGQHEYEYVVEIWQYVNMKQQISDAKFFEGMLTKTALTLHVPLLV